MRSTMLMAGAVVWVLAGVVGVASGGQAADDPMLKGLQDRGLKTLMDLYAKQKPVAPVAPVGPAASADTTAKAAFYQKQALAARNLGEREDAFKQAKALYEEAIKNADKAAEAISQDKIVERSQARLALLRMRETVGNMIFLQWLKNDLDFLEVTDRRFGERNTALELLKAAGDQYRACLDDATAWRGALDRMTIAQRNQLVNSGIERQVIQIQREVRYSIAWTTYYTAWLLPKDYKPADKGMTRADMLNDAITKFQEFTRLPDKAGPKWFSLMVTALAYRELGDNDKALQALSMADNEAAPVAARVRIAYERALTLLRKGDLKKARETVDEALAFWQGKVIPETKKPVLESERFAVALPLLKAESLMLEGKQTNDKALTEEGSKIFGDYAKRGNPWSVIVPRIVGQIIGEEAVINVAETDPTLLWIRASDSFRIAEKAKDDMTAATPEYKKAAEYYAAYAAKVGPADKDYDTAMRAAAYSHLQLNERGPALKIYQDLAEKAANPEKALEAARAVVGMRGEIYQGALKDPSANVEASRAAYEQTLKWFLAKWPNADPEQGYYLGNILYVGGKYSEAALAFAKVAPTSEHYPDARYWLAMGRWDQFRKNVLPKAKKDEVISEARQASKDLMAYSDYAASLLAKGDLPEERQKLLKDQALATTMAAAETYLLNEVMLPQDALTTIGTLKQRFGNMLQGDALGHVLLMEIISYQLLGQLDKAASVLDDYLKVAKPEEVGPVLDGLFKAMIESVRDLIARNQKEQAAAKVDEARKMGDRLREWLAKSAIPEADKAKQIESMRYDVAELVLAVGKFGEALDLYKDIGGGSPEDAKTTGGFIKEGCLYGQARAHEGLADAEADATRSRPHYEKAAMQWSRLVEIAEARSQAERPDRTKKGAAGAEALAPADLARQALWERIYHFYYCRYKLGYAKEVSDSLNAREALMRPEPLGGYKDQALQAKFRDLVDNASGDAGLTGPAAPPAASGTTPTSAAPAPTPPAAPTAPAPTPPDAPAAPAPAPPAAPAAAAAAGSTSSAGP